MMEERGRGRNRILPTYDAGDDGAYNSYETSNVRREPTSGAQWEFKLNFVQDSKKSSEDNNESSSANSLEYFEETKPNNGDRNEQLCETNAPFETKHSAVEIVTRTTALNIIDESEQLINKAEFATDMNSNNIGSFEKPMNVAINSDAKPNEIASVGSDGAAEPKVRKKPEVMPRRRITNIETATKSTVTISKQSEATTDTTDSVSGNAIYFSLCLLKNAQFEVGIIFY